MCRARGSPWCGACSTRLLLVRIAWWGRVATVTRTHRSRRGSSFPACRFFFSRFGIKYKSPPRRNVYSTLSPKRLDRWPWRRTQTKIRARPWRRRLLQPLRRPSCSRRLPSLPSSSPCVLHAPSSSAPADHTAAARQRGAACSSQCDADARYSMEHGRRGAWGVWGGRGTCLVRARTHARQERRSERRAVVAASSQVRV